MIGYPRLLKMSSAEVSKSSRAELSKRSREDFEQASVTLAEIHLSALLDTRCPEGHCKHGGAWVTLRRVSVESS